MEHRRGSFHPPSEALPPIQDTLSIRGMRPSVKETHTAALRRGKFPSTQEIHPSVKETHTAVPWRGKSLSIQETRPSAKETLTAASRRGSFHPIRKTRPPARETRTAVPPSGDPCLTQEMEAFCAGNNHDHDLGRSSRSHCRGAGPVATPGSERDTVLAITYVLVVFSILFQGLTVGPLARRFLGDGHAVGMSTNVK